MLAEAARNCKAAGVVNSVLAVSDDRLSRVEGDFDLVHSVIVLLYIETAGGLRLIEQLIARVWVGGIGVLHVTFAWDALDADIGIAPPSSFRPRPSRGGWASGAGLDGLLGARTLVAPPAAAASEDPEMQVNFYNFSQVLYLPEKAGVARTHLEFTNHRGCVGAFAYFQRTHPH